jgi:uncharacterized delta-60 repeat protein
MNLTVCSKAAVALPKWLPFLLGAVLLCTIDASAQAQGLLDETFNATAFFADKFFLTINDIALQTDGKILVVGTWTGTGPMSQDHIVRLNPDGSADTSFRVDARGVINTVVVQPDGRILLGAVQTNFGGITGTSGFVRLNVDGTIDTSFNSNLNGVQAIALQPDGKIVVAGSSVIAGVNRVRVHRLNPNGTLDPAFAPTNNLPGQSGISSVRSIALQSDGKILVVGAFTQISGGARKNLARLNPDGTLDTGFNPAGCVLGTTPTPCVDGEVTRVAVQPDGKILVGGRVLSFTGRPYLARLNLDGSLDASFLPFTSFTSINTTVEDMVIQPNGKIVVAGAALLPAVGIVYHPFRLNPDGSVDHSFNPNVGAGLAVALQPDGKILVGNVNPTLVPRTGIARLLSGEATVPPPVDLVDSDADGLPNGWETQFGLNPNSASGNDGATGDMDGDGVTNISEYQAGTDPTLSNLWILPEGATGFFTERIAVANPGTDAATFTVAFLPESGSSVTQTYTLAAQSRTTITVNEVPGLSSAAVSAVLSATRGGIVAERTMLWDARDGSHYGGHTGKAIAQARTTWYLAEGEASFFDTYILLANASSSAATVTLSFLLENGNTITDTRTVPANARVTVYTNDVAGLRGNAFSTTITSSIPITVERAMYFGNAVRLFNGGHGSAAVEAPATSWFVAEGRTGPFFDVYLLLANPGTVAANVTIRFLKPGGVVVTQTRTLNPTSRTTIHVDSVPGLADTDVSASITSDQPIIVERAMYWPDPFTNWYEAHNSAGVTATGTRWALAEGEIGGSLSFETYILLANPGSADATVTLTFLRTSGTNLTLTRTVTANSRLTIAAVEAGLTAGEQFGVLIDSTQPIAVERAMYWNGDGQFWGAGTNETGVRIR